MVHTIFQVAVQYIAQSIWFSLEIMTTETFSYDLQAEVSSAHFER